MNNGTMIDAETVTARLGGQWHGSYGMVRCPAHTDRTPSCKVWNDGDGAVLVFCFAGCDWRAVKDVLRNRGLLPEWSGDGTSVTTLSDPVAIVRREKEREAEEAQRIEAARGIWREALPAAGTPVATYLAGRGIDFLPPSLRFAGGLRHARTGLILPCMIAGVQNVTGAITGIHRTFLRADGRVKAPVTNNRMMLGRCTGGAVRFAKAGPRLGICEGIETGLSVAQSCPGLAVWAALSTSGLRAIVLPDVVRNVVVLADADEPGEAAAQDAAQRFLREGREVRIARPHVGKDFNDALLVPSNVVAFRPVKKVRHG